MSEPFLPNTAQDAKSTSETSRSARSRATGVGWLKQSPWGALRLGGGLDFRVVVAEDHRPVGAEEIDVPIAVGVPVAAALAARGVVRRGQRQHGRRVVWPYMPPGITRAARSNRASEREKERDMTGGS